MRELNLAEVAVVSGGESHGGADSNLWQVQQMHEAQARIGAVAASVAIAAIGAAGALAREVVIAIREGRSEDKAKAICESGGSATKGDFSCKPAGTP